VPLGDDADEHLVVMGHRHPERRIQTNRCGVVPGYVQHAAPQALRGQIAKPCDGECTTQPLAVVGRVDTNHVDLAGWFRSVMVVRSAVVVVMVHVRVAVYLRPAKTSNTSINFVHEETMWIEPRLGKTLGEHIVVPVTLLGMAGKCTSVHLEPFVVVDTRAKCAGDEPVRRAMARIEGQGAAHE